MRRKLQGVIACCQEANPSDATGGGGDRCTESCASMIDCSYRLGPLAKTIDNPGANPVAIAQQVMYELTRMLNGGSNISRPEGFQWVSDWLHNNGYDKVVTLADTHLPSFADVKRVIDAGHMAVIGVNDYSFLHLANGTDPYGWPENEHAGHVLMLIGYDDNYNGTGEQTIIVDDPLRSDPRGTEVDYSYKSLQNATFADLIEVVGKPFPIVGDSLTPPAPSAVIEAYCVDVSKFQGSIDWVAYHAWSQKTSPDGKSHVIMRASQDVVTLDSEFERNWAGAVAAGVDEITVYHYCYPQDDSAASEAAWFNKVVGTRLRAQDRYMIDFEETAPAANSAWLLAMCQEMTTLTGRRPIIYANLNEVKTRLQDPALSAYSLNLADWTYDPNTLPACPAPFTSMLFVQYSDKGTVPGISGPVDLDVFLGGAKTVAAPYVVQSDGSWVASNGGHTWGWILDCARNSLANPNDVNLFARVFGLPMTSQIKTADGYWQQTFSNIVVRVNQQNQSDFSFLPNVNQAALDAANAQITNLQAQVAALQNSQTGTNEANAKAALQSAHDQLVPGLGQALQNVINML
jgi:lysozyme